MNQNIREASHIDFVHEKRHMDVGGWGGGWRLWRFSVKIMENFDSLFENFNILNSSYTKYTKSSIFVSVFIFKVYLYAHYQVLALLQVYSSSYTFTHSIQS